MFFVYFDLRPCETHEWTVAHAELILICPYRGKTLRKYDNAFHWQQTLVVFSHLRKLLLADYPNSVSQSLPLKEMY